MTYFSLFEDENNEKTPLLSFLGGKSISYGNCCKLLDRNGRIVYNNQTYRSPSGAGKDASGWKSCNGWIYWHYQHPETKEWQVIQNLRLPKE